MIPLHERLDRTVQSIGDKEALCSPYDRLSYTDLLTAANRIANALRGGGVAPGDRVGLYLDKSVMAVAAIFGILKTGACYVPIDQKTPVIRLQTIVQQCGINTMITTTSNVAALLAVHQQTGLVTQLLLMDDKKLAEGSVQGLHIITRTELDQEAPSLKFIQNISVDAVAVILMTSGTTGKPKGVVLTHKNVLIFSQWVVERFQLASDDRLASHAPLCFDLSLLDIFATISAGACVVLVPSNKISNPGFLLRLIDQEKITLWQSVPTVLTLMAGAIVDCRYDFSSLRQVLFAGERFAVKYLKVLMNLFSQASFYNIYGCTETNDSFIYEVPKADIPEQLPIGKSLPYVNYKIMDNHGEESLEGELWIDSPTTMLGYWRDGQAHSMDSLLREGIRYYRSADLVRVLDDGNILLLGRTDNVIKSSGYRINLLEIETCLLRHSDIAEAAVVALNDEWANKKIVAVVVTQYHGKLSTIAVRQHCAEIIPHYMIPNLIKIQKQCLSKTVSGKVDKQFIIEELTRGMYASNNNG